jgi:hypothetical protein
LYAVWAAGCGTAIARYDPWTRTFAAPWGIWNECPKQSLGGEIVKHVFGIVEARKNSNRFEASRAKLLGVAWKSRVGSGIEPDVIGVRLVPVKKMQLYRLDELGMVRDAASAMGDPNPERANLQPLNLRLLRRKAKPQDKGVSSLLLMVGGFSRIGAFESTDEGKTWQPPRTILKVEDGLHAFPVETAKGEVLFFYNLCGPHVGLQISRSFDGKEWTKAETVPIPLALSYGGAACTGDDGTLWMVLVGKTKKKPALFLTRSQDHGKTWAKPLQVTEGEQEDSQPDIAAKGKDLFVAFTREGAEVRATVIPMDSIRFP